MVAQRGGPALVLTRSQSAGVQSALKERKPLWLSTEGKERGKERGGEDWGRKREKKKK